LINYISEGSEGGEGEGEAGEGEGEGGEGGAMIFMANFKHYSDKDTKRENKRNVIRKLLSLLD